MHDRCWVESLSIGDLWHYAEMATARRSERLREELHTMVSASLAAHDGGESAGEMDKALRPKTPPKATQQPASGTPIPETLQRIAESPDVMGAVERMPTRERRRA